MSGDALDWLFALGQFGIKFGLDNIRALVEALDHPERSFRAVHIAGTNGKGSVSAMVEAALRAAGYRTGRYTSPHLTDIGERFAIDGRPAARDSLLTALERVRAAADALKSRGLLLADPTFFEVTTAAAFVQFREAGADVAVVEVGLGGRLDATNVLTPEACAITSIALDHEQYLGNTLDAIAREKAGILKTDVPAVVGPVPVEAAHAIADRAEQVRAPLVRAFDGVEHDEPAIDASGEAQSFRLRTPRRDYGKVRLALLGRHQLDNAVVAVRLLEALEGRGMPVDASHVLQALATVRWPGRLERVTTRDGRVAILDAAHNPAGAEALARHLAGTKRPIVFGTMRDKDASAMIGILARVASEFVVTQAANSRAVPAEAIADVARQAAPDVPVHVASDASAALDRAWSASPEIVVAGSIFLLGDVLSVLGRS
ncbi:MAG: folylpolyglutamate synthase/dihydrofolate synthase family protein [Vicinamibacterales bacterium]